MHYADKLRQLADYLDDHYSIAEEISGRWDYPGVSLYPVDAETFSFLCSDLGGFYKSAYNGTVSARHTEETGEGETTFTVSVHLAGACTPVPVINDDGTPKMRPVTRYQSVETGDMEAVVEYHCPESFLNLK